MRILRFTVEYDLALSPKSRENIIKAVSHTKQNLKFTKEKIHSTSEILDWLKPQIKRTLLRLYARAKNKETVDQLLQEFALDAVLEELNLENMRIEAQNLAGTQRYEPKESNRLEPPLHLKIYDGRRTRQEVAPERTSREIAQDRTPQQEARSEFSFRNREEMMQALRTLNNLDKDMKTIVEIISSLLQSSPSAEDMLIVLDTSFLSASTTFKLEITPVLNSMISKFMQLGPTQGQIAEYKSYIIDF